MFDEVGYAYLLRAVRRLTGVDLTCYRQGQLRRRLEALVQRVGASGFMEYARLLEREPARLQEFRDYFTINVSEFFRDADRYRYLEQQVLPGLLAARPSLRIWSAGCSIGAEPYSVAILPKELAPRGAHRIVATDVDHTVLDRARRGDGYGPADLRQVTRERLARYFTAAPDGQTHAARPELKALVAFREHHLLGAAPGEGCDLILSRSVVIYFTDDAKSVLYQRFVGALRPCGALFVGGTEIVRGADELGLVAAGPSFYRKEAATSRAFGVAPGRRVWRGGGGRRAAPGVDRHGRAGGAQAFLGATVGGETVALLGATAGAERPGAARRAGLLPG